MTKITALTRKDGFVLSPDNPFKADWERLMATAKTVTRTEEMQGRLMTEKITMVFEKQYLPKGFTKLYKNAELDDLTPYACKILIHIAVNMEYEAESIQLSAKKVGLNPRTYSKAMLELLSQRILVKQQGKHYWVNVTVLMVGRLQPFVPQE